jgi:hypothetical protein
VGVIPLDRIDRIARTQHGLVTLADLASLEVTRAQRRTLVSGSLLERSGDQTFRLAGSPATDKQRVMLACLDLDASASHQTSAAMHQSGPFDLGGRPDVIVRHGRQSTRSAIARVWTTTTLGPDDIVRIDGIPCLNLARTLMVLAAQVPPIKIETLRDMVDVAVRDGMATDGWLWWRLESLRRSGRSGVRIFSQILDDRASGGATESWLEREFLRVVGEVGLPLPVTQAYIRRKGAFVARVDFLFEEAKVVVEVSGQRGHSTAAERSRDAARRNELQLQGYRVLEFTYSHVVNEPTMVVRKLREALSYVPAA